MVDRNDENDEPRQQNDRKRSGSPFPSTPYPGVKENKKQEYNQRQRDRPRRRNGDLQQGNPNNRGRDAQGRFTGGSREGSQEPRSRSQSADRGGDRSGRGP
eukprot:3241106-Rhodomonas_salina.1